MDRRSFLQHIGLGSAVVPVVGNLFPATGHFHKPSKKISLRGYAPQQDEIYLIVNGMNFPVLHAEVCMTGIENEAEIQTEVDDASARENWKFNVQIPIDFVVGNPSQLLFSSIVLNVCLAQQGGLGYAGKAHISSYAVKRSVAVCEFTGCSKMKIMVQRGVIEKAAKNIK